MLDIARWTILALLAAPQAQAGTLILNQKAYFRYYCQFGLMRISAEALKAAEGEKDSARTLKALERQTKRFVTGRDWTSTDWRDEAVCYFSRIGGQVRREDVRAPYAPPPPPDWMQPDFDDAGWMRHRLGGVVGPEDANDFTFLYRRGVYLRGAFEVPDPAGAGDLTLRMTYRGGVRVFVNGAEVARGHLPPGRPGPRARAEDYPEEAYVGLVGECYRDRRGVVGEVIGRYENAPRYGGHREFRRASLGGAINLKGWQRLQKLRDRALGTVTIPAGRLRKGRNVLAIEVRSSHYHPRVLPGYGGPRAANWGIHGGVENFSWAHAGVASLLLRCPSGRIPSGLRRAAGVRLWAADMHDRIYDTEFLAPGETGGAVRIVAAPNGSFSGQVVVGSDAVLTGLTASAGELKAAGGAVLPRGCLRVLPMPPHPIADLGLLSGGGMARMSPASRMQFAFQRHGPRPAKPGEEWTRLLGFFDHISPRYPRKVAPDRCQALWLQLDVPAGARAGSYAGSVRVAADGVRPVTIPVRAEIHPWRVCDPRDFQTVVALEQSPYGVAGHYQVRPWSEEHFRLTEASFRQLGRVGNDWLFVPVISNTEFGNRDDAMIRWIRRRDGSLAFDYAVMDRYIELARRHCGTPRVICFVVMQGSRNPASVQVLDETSGKTERLDLGNAAPHFRAAWSAFAVSLWEHMKSLPSGEETPSGASARGLEGRMYWGFCWDQVADPALIELLAEFVPEVKWARGCHSRYPDKTFEVSSTIILEMLPGRSRRGWKNPTLHLVNPRWGNTTACANGTSNPFALRLLIDRSVVAGHRGVARLGADYWDGTWLKGYGRLPYLYAGMPCAFFFWPGPAGAESSARFEALREGLQETEARIFMEQALDRGLIDGDLAERAQDVLDRHNRQTLFYPSGDDPPKVYRYCHGWQERSARLLSMAAEVAEKVGLDTSRGELHVAVPARGKVRAAIRLRNWTARARPFKVAADRPWLVPGRGEGLLTGQQDLPITIDARNLRAGSTASGTVTITDVSPAGGGARAVKVSAAVSELFEFLAANLVFNVTAGGSESRRFVLINRSGSELRFRAAGQDGWLTARPAAGTLPPGGRAFLTVTAAPTDKGAAVRKAALTLTEAPDGGRPPAGRAPARQVEFTAIVIPPYRRPALPGGRAVPLETLGRKRLKSHTSHGEGWVTGRNQAPIFQTLSRYHHGEYTLKIAGRTYASKGIWVVPRHETVYRLEGGGFSAFSAEVGVNYSTALIGDTSARANFEVHVDGTVRAQSGLMSAADECRLLAVDGLTGAKEIKLVTRLDRLVSSERIWCNWVEMKLYRPAGAP